MHFHLEVCVCLPLQSTRWQYTLFWFDQQPTCEAEFTDLCSLLRPISLHPALHLFFSSTFVAVSFLSFLWPLGSAQQEPLASDDELSARISGAVDLRLNVKDVRLGAGLKQSFFFFPFLEQSWMLKTSASATLVSVGTGALSGTNPSNPSEICVCVCVSSAHSSSHSVSAVRCQYGPPCPFCCFI